MGKKRETNPSFCRRCAFLLFILSSGILFSACAGGVSRVKWIASPGYVSDVAPYGGRMSVSWKTSGLPENLIGKKYYFLGRISGRSTWCGIVPPIQNEELQNHLIDQARQKGGNAIILECGYGGYEPQCYCYGDVLLFVD
jgi:hypothetical protein